MNDDPGAITWDQLRHKAKLAGIKGYAKLNRDQLLQALGLPDNPGASLQEKQDAARPPEPVRAALIRINEGLDVLELVTPFGVTILAMALNGVVGQGQTHKVRALKELAANRGFTVTSVVKVVNE
jgi:hypothetical protein